MIDGILLAKIVLSMLVVADVIDLHTAQDLINRAERSFIRGIPPSQYISQIVSLLAEEGEDNGKKK